LSSPLDHIAGTGDSERESGEPALPSRRHFLGVACAVAAAAATTAESRPSDLPSSISPSAPGLTATRLESLELTAVERSFLTPITAIWECAVGNDTPVTEFHVTPFARDRSRR
jgi:hypothetical protein